MKKLHDLLLLKLILLDIEKKRVPLAQIVGRTGIKWEPEFPVDKGWIDIYVPEQKNVERAYIIEVETGYDLNCSEVLRKFERFRKAIRRRTVEATRPPKLCVVIPKDFVEFFPLFTAKEISIFLWEGKLEWKCKECGKITLGSAPWKPKECGSCSKKEHFLRLVGLRDFRIQETTIGTPIPQKSE